MIYLDQNHWSTITFAIHEPSRVANNDELEAARHLATIATSGTVVLPMSAGHMSETCQQVDMTQRYSRALTLIQLAAGWQLRDPLHLRQLELRQTLTSRYHRTCLNPPAAVTLEPGAFHAGRTRDLPEFNQDLPADFRWAIQAARDICGCLDMMLDEEHIPKGHASGWAKQFEDFARFMADNPTDREMKRRRTWAKFVADMTAEIVEAAKEACVTSEQMAEWVMSHSETDIPKMRVLGLYREVLHEKLCNPALRWEQNDLNDMMYLTAAAGHCDYVVAERAHASHLDKALERLGRRRNVHRNLRSLVDHLLAAQTTC